MAEGLNARQKKFCDEYIKDFNGARAYMAAYPDVTYDTARNNASRLLASASVKQYIEKNKEEVHRSDIADAEEIYRLLTEIARGESQKGEVVVIEGKGNGFSEARRMNKKPDEKDRLKAIELLGKANSIFTDKVDVKADIEIKVDLDD